MSKILDFESFLNESEGDELSLAKHLCEDKNLSSLLNDVEEGKFPHIQIMITPGANSYVGVAMNDGESISKVYVTPDPKIALVAIIIKNTGREDAEEISSIIESDDAYLNYAVFAGDRPMSRKEVADKYNFTYDLAGGNTISYYTSTPIRKTY